VELGAIVKYKGETYEVIQYATADGVLFMLTLKSERETIRLQGEKQCRNAKVVR